MNSKKQGDLGVAIAIAYYTKKGYAVSIPLGDNTRYDLIIDDGTRLLKVQVKTTGHVRHNYYIVSFCTQGGNQSWNGVVKVITEDEVDLVFVYTLGGSAYEFPVAAISGKKNLVLGDKVVQYRVGGK